MPTGIDDVAAALTRSPRGLAVLSDLCGEDLDVWPRRLTGPLDDPEAHPFDTRRPAIHAAAPDRPVLDDPERLAVEVLLRGAGHAWRPDRQLAAEAVARSGPAFLSAARDLMTARGSQWWGDGIARRRQVLLGPPDELPEPELRTSPQWRMAAGGYEGRIPRALATSRRFGDRLPAVALCDQDAPRAAGDGPVGCWSVQIAPEARVYEVHGPEDWKHLLARYPQRITTTDDLARWGVTTADAIVPDWEAFAREWDGVHVSMLGVLTADSVVVEVDGLGGVLADADTEATAWFRPCLTEPRLIATVPRDELPHYLPWP